MLSDFFQQVIGLVKVCCRQCREVQTLANMHVKNFTLYSPVAKAFPFVHNRIRKQLINLGIVTEHY